MAAGNMITIEMEEGKKIKRNLKELFPDRPFINKAIYLITNKMVGKSDLKLKHYGKFFSQEWERGGGPSRIKEMLLGHFGSIDLRNYNGQTPDHLKKIYDDVGIKILD